MNRIYKVGTDNTALIKLEVKVNTAGTAFTRADLNRSGGTRREIAESNPGSGDIPNTNVGLALELKEGVLVVTTVITLGTIKQDRRSIARDNIRVFYKVSGGFSNDQVYNQDLDDVRTFENGKIIVINKPIRFIE